MFEKVRFHLLDESGTRVEETIDVSEQFRERPKEVKLQDWFSVEGKPCLVERIAVSLVELDVFVKPIGKMD